MSVIFGKGREFFGIESKKTRLKNVVMDALSPSLVGNFSDNDSVIYIRYVLSPRCGPECDIFTPRINPRIIPLKKAIIMISVTGSTAVSLLIHLWSFFIKILFTNNQRTFAPTLGEIIQDKLVEMEAKIFTMYWKTLRTFP